MQQYIDMILKKAKPAAYRFRYLIVGALVLATFGYAGFKIDTFLQVDRDQATYDEKLLEIKSVEFDDSVIERIRSLNKSSAEITGDLDEDRTNPFGN